MFFRSNFTGALFWCPHSVFVFSLFRLLQNKPEAARKALSDNSLLKNIDFNEKFLGEEHISDSKRTMELIIVKSLETRVGPNLYGETCKLV